MSTMRTRKMLLLLAIVLFCLGCNKQDDLLIRTIVIGGGLFSDANTFNIGAFIVFTPDGTTIVNGSGKWSSNDNVMKLWRVSDGSLQYTIRMNAKNGNVPAVTAITFDPSGRLLATGHSDNIIRIWRLSDGSLLKAFKSPYVVITGLSYSPDGKILAGCHSVGTLILWNMENDSIIRTQWPSSKMEGSFVRAKFNSDGSELITGMLNGEILILRVKDGELLRKFGESDIPGYPEMISLVVARSENVLATIHTDGFVKIWRISDGSLVKTIKSDPSIFNRVALNTQGNLLAIGSYYSEAREAGPSDWFGMIFDKRNYSVKLYRTSDGILLHSFKGHKWDVTSVNFSPDDKLLASFGMDRSIKIWDIRGFK